jgi:hypothetical protein
MSALEKIGGIDALVAHVGCGTIDAMHCCPLCEVIRTILKQQRGTAYLIEGFGVPGDRAVVEADSPDAAKRRLLEEFTAQCIDDIMKPIHEWVVVEAIRPLLVIRVTRLINV